MKKQVSLALAAVMAAGMLTACGGGAASSAPASSTAESTAASTEAAAGDALSADITLWTYPVGNFKDETAVGEVIANFNAKYPGINVKVEYLDYANGDDQVTAAIEAGTTPDIILEGPERLVANWGAKGKMLDISDLWTDEQTKDIAAVSESVVAACKNADGVYYEFPLCMTTHTMAINKEMFEAADALQYINEDGTWTTENFEKALQALKDSGVDSADHQTYTADSAENKKALQQLVDWSNAGLISYDASFAAADELQLFANGTIAMSFCWNASNQNQYASSVTFTPMPVAFPSDDGVPELCGGIWGFGIFDNGDATRAAAAKEFVKFVCEDPDQAVESVRMTGFFPVRASLGDVYAGTADADRMAQFSGFMPYLGDYYNVAPAWAEQRTEWWNMLQRCFMGTAVDESVQTYIDNCNAAIAAA